MHQHTAWQTRGDGKTFSAKFVRDDVPDRCMWSKCFSKLPGESEKSVISYLMFECPTMLHLPKTSGRSIDTEHLSGWLGWRDACVCASPVWLLLLLSARAKTTEQECSGQFTELQMGGSKGDMYSLLWFSRKQIARAWPAPHGGLFRQSEFMLGSRHKWII